MIGKVMIGKGFSGCISYCLSDKKIKAGLENETRPIMNRAEVLIYNQCFGDRKSLTSQFTDVRKLNLKQSRPVLHLTLSFAPGEQIDRPQLLEIIEDCASDFGFEDNQYISVQHHDTGHQHIHIVANRINLDGKTNVSDSNNFKKIADFCRKTELKYGLVQVVSPRRFLSMEQKLIPRNDERKQKLKAVLKEALVGCKSMEDYCKKVEALGIQVIKERGISFKDIKGVKVKGSEIGLSLQVIQKQLLKNSQAQEIKPQIINLSQRKIQIKL
jgi:hypothetical protein